MQVDKKSKRELVIEWWNGLSFEIKAFTVVKHKELVAGYPDRLVGGLTGREIEQIYNAEHN